MRERVAAMGGTIDAGPRPGGGWRVSTMLPIDQHAPHGGTGAVTGAVRP